MSLNYKRPLAQGQITSWNAGTVIHVRQLAACFCFRKEHRVNLKLYQVNEVIYS